MRGAEQRLSPGLFYCTSTIVEDWPDRVLQRTGTIVAVATARPGPARGATRTSPRGRVTRARAGLLTKDAAVNGEPAVDLRSEPPPKSRGQARARSLLTRLSPGSHFSASSRVKVNDTVPRNSVPRSNPSWRQDLAAVRALHGLHRLAN